MGVAQEATERSILNHPHPSTPPRKGEGITARRNLQVSP